MIKTRIPTFARGAGRTWGTLNSTATRQRLFRHFQKSKEKAVCAMRVDEPLVGRFVRIVRVMFSVSYVFSTTCNLPTPPASIINMY
jgi:hypothetical protein